MASAGRPKRKATSPLPVAKRTKNFTGCWTCRLRSIKCGEEKPSCLNCSKKKRQCGGYGIRLCWPDSNNQKYDSIRSYILYETKEDELLDKYQVNYFLEKIDAVSQFLIGTSYYDETNQHVFGPFTVFCQFGSNSGNGKSNPQNAPFEELSAPMFDGINMNADTILDSNLDPNFQFYANLIESSSFDLAAIATDRTTENLRYSNIDLYSKNLDGLKFARLDPSSGVEASLLDFWDVHLSVLLSPVKVESLNPFKKILEFGMNIFSSSDIKNVLLHSICSITASFLARPRKNCAASDLAKYERYWKFHHSKALHFISKAYVLLDESNIEENVVLVASIILLLTIDAIHPDSCHWKVHVRGVLTIVKKINLSLQNPNKNELHVPGAEYSDTMKFLLKMNKLTYIFGSSDYAEDVNGDESQRIGIRDFDVIDAMDEPIRDSILYQAFGVSDPMLAALSDIVYLIQNKNDSINYEAEVQSLEKKILDSRPQKLKDPDLSNVGGLSNIVMYHQSSIFHIATYVYFLREVLHKKPIEIQEIVNEGIDHIEIDQELSKGSNTVGLLWPCFVIACEATTKISQLRIKNWANLISGYDIANVTSAVEIIYTLWERRLKDDDISWRVVKKEVNPKLMLS